MAKIKLTPIFRDNITILKKNRRVAQKPDESNTEDIFDCAFTEKQYM